MTFPNPGPATQSTGNVAGGPYVAYSGTRIDSVIGPAGTLIPFGGGGGGVALYDGANSITSGTARFSNANGVSFGFNGQTITASAAGAISAGVSTGGNTSGNTGTHSGQLVFAGGNNITLSVSSAAGGAQTITISGANAGGAQTGISSIGDSANTQTVGMLSFANSNGISFGLSTGANTGTLTASYTVPSTAGLISAINLSAGTTSNNASVFTFSNSNGVSFGLNASTITASVATSLTNINFSAGTTSNNLSALTFSNSNGISFGLNASTVTASYTVPATAGLISGLNVSGGAGNSQSNVTGMTFSNLNGLTFGVSTGANVVTVTGSYTVPTQTNQTLSAIVSSNTVGNTSAMTFDARSVSFQGFGIASVGLSTTNTGSSILFSATQSNQAVSAQGGSSAFQTLVFTNSNNISFSNTGGSVWGSYALNVSAGGGTSNALSAITFTNSNGVSFGLSTGAGVGTMTASVAAQSNQTGNIYGIGNTSGTSSGTYDARTLSIDAIGGAITVAASNSGWNLSVPQTSSLSGTGIVSVATNGSTISVGAGPQLSFVVASVGNVSTVSQLGNGSVQIFPVNGLFPFSASRADILISNSISSSSNSSHAGVISVYMGMYTRTGSSISQASSGSQSFQWTNTSNNSMASVSALRRLSVPLNVNYLGGDVWVVVMSRTSSTNANWFTASNVIGQPLHTAQLQGLIGEASNNTKQFVPGVGVYSVSSTNLPGSMGFSEITGAGSNGAGINNYMQPVFFVNQTA